MLSGWPKLRNANGMLSGYPRLRNSNGMLSGYPRPAGAYADLVLATAGLVGYWKLNEPAGATTARDSSPNGYHMTHTGAITPGYSPGLIPGFTATAYAGNSGDRTKITKPVTTVVDNWAMEAWITCTLPQSNWAGEGGMIMQVGTNGNGYGMGIGAGTFGPGSRLYYLRGGIAWHDSGYTLPTSGATYHIVVARVGGTTRFYSNGVEVGSSFASAPSTPATQTDIGGYSADGQQFRGRIGHAAVYAQGLSAAQILAHYNAGLAG